MSRFSAALAAVLLSAFVFGSCTQKVLNPITASGNELCLWVSSDKDAYVSTGPAGQEVDQNFGLHGSLAVATGPLGRKQSYVHFTPPTLPAGSEVLEARFELFHGAKNGDGTTDDRLIAVGRVLEAWSPLTVTWTNQPFARLVPTSFTQIRLRSQAWSGTPNIAGEIAAMIATPSSNHGFIVWYPDQTGQQMDKGFYSNNDVRRKQDDLGLSPRLVMRVKLPDGKTANDLQLGFLPADHDLARFPQPIRMVNVVSSSSWPSSWQVTNE